MMKKKLLITLSVVACALLLVVGSIAGTIAYMTSKTGVVTNTFTSGNVAITLDETDVDEYGVAATDAARVIENKYKLIPGRTYTKDPVIHVAETSESAWLFVKIENGIDGIDLEDDTTQTEDGSIADQLTTNGWKCIDVTNNIWAYQTATDGLKAQDVDTFSKVTLKTDADVSQYEGKTITVQAYAVQADGFKDAAAAWAAAPLAEWTTN